MANTRIFLNTEFTAIDYILENENLPGEWGAACWGVLAHDLDDVNRDGDTVFCWEEVPETEEDARAMLYGGGSCGTTFFRIGDGKYIVEG